MPLHPIQPIQYGYIIFSLLMLILMIVFVPRQEIRRLFWFGLLWGPVVDILLVWIIKAVNFYEYTYLPPFEFLGAPIWNALAWMPAIILFIYFLPNRKEKYLLPVYIGLFSMVGVFIGAYYTELGLVHEIHFHYLLRFPIWYLWFAGAYWHYRKLKAEDPKTI